MVHSQRRTSLELPKANDVDSNRTAVLVHRFPTGQSVQTRSLDRIRTSLRDYNCVILLIMRVVFLALWFFVSAVFARANFGKFSGSINDGQFEDVPAVRERINDIYKSERDYRDYRFLELGNRMKVMLISDPHAMNEAVSLTVLGGSLSDPRDMHGLAHYLEHSVFLGSRHYPDENAFSKFLKENGGQHNAATSHMSTTYFFDIRPGKVVEGVERLVDMVANPILHQNSIAREIKAVNSEWKMNKVRDVRQMWQIFYSASDPNHPFNSFTAGNSDTIFKNRSVAEVARRLKDYHETHYSANLMSIAILTKSRSLDDLENSVIETLLSVPNLDLPTPIYRRPFREYDLGKIYRIMPLNQMQQMTIFFQMPDSTDQYKFSPAEYFTSLIGHEGPESLLHEIKRQGLGTALLTKTDRLARGIEFFQVRISLTRLGLDDWKAVVRLLFEYVKMLQTLEPDRRYWKEIVQRKKMVFENHEQRAALKTVNNIVSKMSTFGPRDIISGTANMSEWHPRALRESLSHLRPDNMIIFQQSNKFENKVNKQERWYGGQYHVEEMKSQFIDELNEILPKPYFAIPAPNIFMPENFKLEPIESITMSQEDAPALAFEDENVKIWHHQDMRFNLPKTHAEIRIKNPEYISSPRSYVLTKIYVMMLNDYFAPTLYQALLAEVNWNLEMEYDGLIISVWGFSDSIPKLLGKIAELISSYEPTEERFNAMRELLVQRNLNFGALQSAQIVQNERLNYTMEGYVTPYSQLKILEAMTFKHIKSYIRDNYDGCKVICLIAGNIRTHQAITTIRSFVKKMKINGPFSDSHRYSSTRSVQLPPGSNFLVQTRAKYSPENAVMVTYQIGKVNMRDKLKLTIIQKLTRDECFHFLRTRRQLGYSVKCVMVEDPGDVISYIILIQSSNSTNVLMQNIEEYIEYTAAYMEKIPELLFESQINQTLMTLDQPIPTLAQQMSTWMMTIRSERKILDFEIKEKTKNLLKGIKLADVIDLYKKRILSPNRARLTLVALSVYETAYDINEDSEAFSHFGTNLTILTDPFEFKAKSNLYPAISDT